MARTPDECRAMIAAAERSGVALKVGFNHRYYGAVMAIRAAIDAGAIGEVRFVRAAIGHEGGAGFTQSWVTRHAVAGGGTLIDNGIHILDLARYLLESQGGRIVEAQGYTINARWPSRSSRCASGCAATRGRRRRRSAASSPTLPRPSATGGARSPTATTACARARWPPRSIARRARGMPYE